MKLPIIAVSIAASAAAAAEEPRGLGAHEHGHGALSIAFEGDRIAMQFEAPGADIVGFEHTAETAEDRAAVEDAVAQLARPADLFAFPEEAGCSVTEAGVELHGEEAAADADHAGEAHDEEGHGDDAHAEGHGHAEGEGHDAGTHSEFHAEYMLACADIGSVTAIEFPNFEVFPNAEELEVQMIGDRGATAVTVERGAPRIDLSKAM